MIRLLHDYFNFPHLDYYPNFRKGWVAAITKDEPSSLELGEVHQRHYGKA